ncbi:leucine-rich repeat protein [Ruminococcus bicirculans (ex Wegman et al. 2014)]|uniref:leucine-rich repeat protein n=1 Tax=Ruminococcus bicirculans (ex Wegman et al. 2014) TaxID=1160721 RepID=UPI003FEE14B8
MNSIFKYTENNCEVIITGLQEDVSDTSIVIPETIDGMPVTAIGPRAFEFASIKDIKIGKNIKEIGEKAFYKCEKLSAVTWNHKCDVIPDFCFFGCSNLMQFDFSGIKKIGGRAFYGSGLQKICLPENIECISGWAFSKCKKLRSVEWNCKCDVIPVFCFLRCLDLTQFDFSGIKKIDRAAFYESGLKEVCLPENIKCIIEGAFSRCKTLSSVKWNCKCNAIPVDCFARCSNLTQFDFSSIKKIGAHAFEDSGLTSVTLSKGTAVDQNCFACCNDLEKIEWLSDRSIEGDIFEECKNIKEIFISDQVKSIEKTAFRSSPGAEITFV